VKDVHSFSAEDNRKHTPRPARLSKKNAAFGRGKL
jgi:hypothetical protein